MKMFSRAQSRFLSLADRLSFLGPTLARLTLGVVFMGTGWGKLHNLEKVTGFFTELGIPAPGFNAVLASSAELICGTLLLCGLLVPRDQMQWVLRRISDFVPLSYAVDGINRVGGSSEVSADLVRDLVVIASVAVVALLLASATLRRRSA